MLEAEARREGFDGPPRPNEVVLQILNDSYDLLIIDLFSLRERLCKTRDF